MSAITYLAIFWSGNAMADNNSVRGIVKAEAAATISSELIAPIEHVPFKLGEVFAEHDIILKFNCRRYEADLMAATAEARSARLTLSMNRSLHKRRAIGAHELAISGTKADQAEARVEAIKVRTDQCIIKAPFEERIVERLINEHEMPQANAPLLKIVKDGALELGLVVPSHWLVWLQPGIGFDFTVEETTTTHAARVLRVGALVDPISRTIIVEASLQAPSDKVRPGMSGTAVFTIPQP